MKLKVTRSQIINRILIINLAILLVFSVFITAESIIFFRASEKMKNTRVNRDNMFLSYVYQNLYSDINNYYSEYRHSDELFAKDLNESTAVQYSDFLSRLVNLDQSIAGACILFKDKNIAVDNFGVMQKEAFFHNMDINNEEEFNNGLYTKSTIRIFQAARKDSDKQIGLTIFVFAFENTAMILVYTTDTLNDLLKSSISEADNQATLFLEDDIICSTFPNYSDSKGNISLESTYTSDYMPIFSTIQGTDFDIVYYKFLGSYDSMNRSIILVSLIFLLLLVFIDSATFFIIRRNFYAPIKSILDKHKTDSEDAETLNEYAELDNILSGLKEKYSRSSLLGETLKVENTFIRMLAGDCETSLSDVHIPYAEFMLLKLVIDSGEDNSKYFGGFEASLNLKCMYKRITINDKLSYFVIDTEKRTALDFECLDKSNIFYLASVSKNNSDTLKEPIEQCEKAFHCTGTANRVVVYRENLKSTDTANLSQDILNNLLDNVLKGKLTAVKSSMSNLFELNIEIDIGHFRSMCGVLMDMLYVISGNTDISAKTLRGIYNIEDMFNYQYIWKNITDLYCEVTQINFEKSDNRILDIIKCVDEEYDTQISLQSLSDRFDLPMEQISRIFKKQTGVNFVNYKQRKRIEKAKEMLLEDKSVNEICQRVGFVNSSTFIKLFEKNVGVTPGKYKQFLLEQPEQ